MHELWTEQQFVQMVSNFAYVYFKDVSAPLESFGTPCVVY